MSVKSRVLQNSQKWSKYAVHVRKPFQYQKETSLGTFWAISNFFNGCARQNADFTYFCDFFFEKSIFSAKKWNFWKSSTNNLKEQLLTVRMSHYWRIFIFNFGSYGNFKIYFCLIFGENIYFQKMSYLGKISGTAWSDSC